MRHGSQRYATIRVDRSFRPALIAFLGTAIMVQKSRRPKRTWTWRGPGTANNLALPSEEEQASAAQRCFRKNYPITDERRRLLMDRMFAIAMYSTRDKAAIQAFRAILEAEQLDLRAVQVAINALAAQTQAVNAGECARIPESELVEGICRLLAPSEAGAPQPGADGDLDTDRRALAGSVEYDEPDTGRVAEGGTVSARDAG